MATNENEEFVLGEEVTAQVSSKARGGSAVVAVRLSLDDIAEVEAIARSSGKNLSQVLREAIRNGLRFDDRLQPTITISVQDVATTTIGAQGQYGQAVKVEYKEEVPEAA